MFMRCYSDTSDGKLISGRGRCYGKLTQEELHLEFKLHSNKSSRTSTHLVSLCSSITRVLHIALAKYLDGELAETIVVVFINSPEADEPQYHSARILAEELGFENSHLFSTEYLAEGEIDPDAVQHSITLRTLIDRGLLSGWDALDENMTSSDDLRHYMGNILFDSNMNPFEIGLALGSISRAFGARAPTTQIARTIMREIAKPYFHEDWGFLVQGHNLAKNALPDVEDLLAVHEGIDTAVIDWWLCDPDFVWSIKNHNSWAERVRSDWADLYEEDGQAAERIALERVIECAAIKCGL